DAADPLMVFCGAAFKKPVEDIINIYQQKTGTAINVVYAGVGTLLTQITLSRQGDVFVVPSPDIMDRAKKRNSVEGASIRNIAYVAPCINTQKGNSMNIRGLKDLTRPGLRIAIGNPQIVYVGALAVEMVEKNLSPDEKAAFRKNVVTYAEDFNKLSTMLVLKQVDAVIGMHFMEGWYPDKVATVKFKPAEVLRIGSAQAAVITYSTKKTEAGRFIDFLASTDAQAIFRKYNYFASTDEAFSWVGGTKPIGGEFAVEKDWWLKK
ncbi:MAG: molybdate ABC transporter substrate-binding protein, partial [Syntrophobacter sp.]